MKCQSFVFSTMNLLILSDANSIHTQRWVLSLNKKGYNVRLFSLFKPNDVVAKLYDESGIKVYSSDLKHKVKNIIKPNLSKLIYLKSIPKIKKIIKSFSPDIIHAHYASSYGLLATIINFRPFILSVWGSDLYDFPRKNFINKWLINRVIQSADCICSTSKGMAKIISEEYNRFDCKVIPFGVDTKLFIPTKQNFLPFTIGTIKSIEEYNGIDCLLNAARIIIYDKKNINVKFLIIGKGTLLKKMQKKFKEFKLENYVKFEGQIPHQKIVKYYQKISVFIAVSTRESFGVSVLEAASCGIPSITSNIGGLPEVNVDKETGYLIPPNDPLILAEKITRLYEQKNLCSKMGDYARRRVVENFDWNVNVTQLINIYKSLG